METDNKLLDQSSDMDLKVRRRVARKVLTDIQDQVDEIEYQVESEKRASLFLIPGLALILLIVWVLWEKPDFLRSLTALF